MRQRRELAAQHGHQADHVVAQARERGQYHVREPEMQAQRAVTWARDHLYERGAVQDRRAVLGAALERGMGETTYAGIRQEFDRLDTNHDGELDVKELEQSQLETAHHGGTHR